ncbi:MAG TPA: tetratricopeptide repeat protein [Acidobacteriota bacterium]|jgi:CHAT domain-containing protein/Tfp pilus assembly protein PilF
MEHARYLIFLSVTVALLATFTSAAQLPGELPGLIVEEAVDLPASKLGLKAGDRLLTYSGKPVPSSAALLAAIDNTIEQEEVALTARRGQETLTLSVPSRALKIRVRPDLSPGVLALYSEGRAGEKAQKRDEQIAKWMAAAKTARDSSETESAAWLYGCIGKVHEESRQWKEAKSVYAEAWELLKGTHDAAAQSRTLAALGRCSQNLSNFAEAQAWFEQSLQIDAPAGNEIWAAGDLSDLGDAARSAGNLAAAQDYHTRALSIRERLLPDSLEVANSINALGNVAWYRSDFKAAQEYYIRALRIKERVAPNSLTLGSGLHNLGLVAYNRGDLGAAQDYHTRALGIREQVAPESLDVALSLCTLGLVVRDRGHLGAAQDYEVRGLAIRERLAPDSLLVATSLNDLGLIARDQGKLQAADGYHARALAIRERLAPDSLMVAVSLNNLGVVARERGDLRAAQDYSTRALAIRERLAPDSLALAESLNTLGNIALGRGDLEAAQDFHNRALAVRLRLTPESLTVAGSLANLGLIAAERGDLQAAHDYYSRALSMYARVALDSPDMASCLNNLGNVAHDRGDLEAAHDYQSRALSIRERLSPDSLNLALSLNNLGSIARDRGDLQTAQNYHTRALSIRERLAPDSLHVAFSLHNLGRVAYDRNDLQLSENYHRRALAIRERLTVDSLPVAVSLSHLGRIASSRGDLAAAQNYWRRAAAIRERMAPNSLEMADSLTQLGILATRQRRFSDSIPLFTRALEIVERQRRQIAFTEARALLMAIHSEHYMGLVRASLELNELPLAFATVERARARSLLDLLAEANVDVQQGIEPLVKQRERDMHARITWIQGQLIQMHSKASPDENKIAQLEEQLKRVDRDREQLEVEIRQKHPRYAELQYPTPLGLKAVQELLDPQTALLEYALSEDRSFLFVVTRTESYVSELPAAASLSNRVKRLRETLIRQPQRTTFPTYTEQARSLYQLLIEPAGKSLAGKQQLVIVPDGILHYLPFEVLLSSGDQRSLTTVAPRRWPYLVRDYALSYVPSATVLASLQSSRQAKPAQEKLLLAFADPAYGAGEPAEKSLLGSAMRSAFGEAKPWRLEPLPQSREEASRIASLYPREKVRLFLQQDAREESVKGEPQLNQYRFVHFAVHGLLNENKPQFSGLVLSLPPAEVSGPKTQERSPESAGARRQAGGEGNPKSATRNPQPAIGDPLPEIRNLQSEDGLLQAYEIFDLKLNADLVVLSACETGLGKEVKGEGLLGLTRAFLYAGAQSVMVSLWKVSDRSTAELMASFYRHLQEKGMTKAEALRKAQLNLINQGRYAAPFYWAPFVLVGEAK